MKSNLNYLGSASPDYIESMYLKYQQDPSSVTQNWRLFFDGYQLGSKVTGHDKNLQSVSLENNPATGQTIQEANVIKLIQAYRFRGHIVANTNPLSQGQLTIPDLTLGYFGLETKDLETVFKAGNDLKIGDATLAKILEQLKATYTSHLSVEFMHCSREVRQWIYHTLEPSRSEPDYDDLKRKKLFQTLSKSVIFEEFLHTKYVGQKRFGLEGGESLIPGIESLVNRGVKLGVREFIFGMAHRGRLNVLVNIFHKSFYHLFSEFEGGVLPTNIVGDGDVKYHLGQSTDVRMEGETIHLSLAFNPSHLEAVNPIVAGMVKGKCKKYYDEDEEKIVPILIHGDSAVAGQGVVYELANMSQLPGYRNGGSIHIVVNNQLGFTTNADESRSSRYCTDVAKITSSPVFHVNGDDVEKVAYALELAIEIRNKFGIDVWVDIIGYRKRGHNEGDEPKFTQPLMYEKISKHPGVYKIYFEELKQKKIISESEAKEITHQFKIELEQNADKAKKNSSHINVDTLKRYWQNIRPSTLEDFEQATPTQVKVEILDQLMKKVLEIPGHFNLFSKMQKILQNRKNLYFEQRKADWAISEQLAFASLLNEGYSVRLTGQDSARGTFGHRHSLIKDIENEKTYCPLEKCLKKKATFRVINSQLSEYSTMGYEYGYSLTRPHALVIWEAQFGDFSNGAQIIIDQFLSSGETKWQRHSGLVLYLPHGYEGMGPEHSSARLERFLQLCAANNMYVVNLTDPANLFHALRRQIKAPFRKPLVIMSPKSLLRHPLATSPVKIFENHFQEIIDDPKAKPKEVNRVIFCTGKIYYDLLEKREQSKKKEVAIVRLEQIYPLSKKWLEKIRKKYHQADEWLWVQEEPVNMGAWSFLNHRLADFRLKCVARKASSSPASGMFKIHQKNQTAIVEQAINEKLVLLKKYY